MRAFLSDASTGQWQRVVILDVGSNNGNWAKSIAQLCQAHRKAPCETVMFEPQPQFKERLTALVGELGRDVTRFEPAAAWRERGHLSFFLSHNTEASSMRSSIANRCKKCRGTTEPTLVRSLDLARYMRDTLKLPTTDRDTLSLVKIDVESGEYELLPHLIAERVLCGIRYLHIEWHLDALPAAMRLSGLALMLSLHHTLKATCTRPGETAPILIVNEESPSNNGLEIPGLKELVPLHSAGADSELGAAWTKAHEGLFKAKGEGSSGGPALENGASKARLIMRRI